VSLYVTYFTALQKICVPCMTVQTLNREAIGNILSSMKQDTHWQEGIDDTLAIATTEDTLHENKASSSATRLTEQLNESVTLQERTNTQDVRASIGAWSHGTQAASRQRFNKYFADEQEDDVEEFLMQDETMKLLDT
jgi:hypothetical protein